VSGTLFEREASTSLLTFQGRFGARLCEKSARLRPRRAYDEVMASGIKRRHEPPRVVGDLLSAEIAEKQARSIKYQLFSAHPHRRACRRA
jgi:hypothetical protein